MVGLVLVILTAVAAGVVILVSQRGSSDSLGALSTAFMKETAARARALTQSYLEVGPKSLEVVRRLAHNGQLDLNDDLATERQLRAQLATHDEIDMINLGLPDGNFMMVKRMPDGSYSTKRIRRDGTEAISTWSHDNPAWSQEEPYADRREPAAQAFDPRARPWYRSALANHQLSWIDPYVFYSDRMPGIACALPLYDAEERLLGVVGADIGIADLSGLLAEFEVGRSGQAVILTDDGRLIAYPEFSRDGFHLAQDIGGSDGPKLVLRHVDELPDSPLATAFVQRANEERASAETFDFDHEGTRFVARFESFTLSAERRWIVAVLAPQADFIGPLLRNHRFTLVVTLLCFVLAIGLASLLVLRADALEIELLRARTVEKQQLIDELEARNAEMERFTYTVSHDLKSPLITIRGYLGMLERDLQVGDEARVQGDLRRIDSASLRMTQLLEELLDLSRIGRQDGEHQEVSMSVLAAEVAEHLDGLIASGGVDLVVAPQMPVRRCDRPRLFEVLQNLIENAVKFMGDQPQPRIEIDFCSDVGDGVFCVRDNGIGIDQRYQSKIFGLFDRLDHGIDGTGIGLALVKRIIEVHGGRIWVESAGEGHGATFCFTLPTDPAATSAVAV